MQSHMQTNISLCLLVNKKDNLHLSNITFNTFGAYSYNLAKEEIPTILEFNVNNIPYDQARDGIGIEY